AQDQQGNMALGFSLSSSALHPEIHYTGRLVGDAAGQMTQGEGTIVNGAGSQSGTRGLTRWGDYSMMSVDPGDDCTFWYTTEYLSTTGEFNWHTRIGSFKFPGCGGTTTTNDFSINANPTTVTVNQGASGTSTISTAVTAGSAQSVALSASGVPSGATASFSPTSVTSGNSSTLTLNAGTAAAGTYTVTVTGTGASATHSTTVSLTVAATPTISIAVSPSSLSVTQGSSGNATVRNSGNTSFDWSVSGLPSGATATPASGTLAAGASAPVVIAAASTTPTGTSTLTFAATGSAGSASAAMQLTVAAPAPNDFSISASPTTVSVTAGGSGTSTISTAVTSGSAQSVSLSASGLPTGASASFNPASLTAGGRSTLTISTASSTPAGSYTVTVTGAGSSATHSTSVTLSVSAPPTGGIANGGFETATLSGWISAGMTKVETGGLGGTYAARVGSTGPFNGDSSISQTFSAPASGSLTFWYKVVCTDTVTYDWATATLTDNTTGAISTVLARTCTNSGAWVQASAAVTAAHSYTLKLVDHDDNFSTDPTYTLYDDVALGSSPPPTGGIVNGGFETGSFTGWTRSGTTSITTVSHSGTYGAVAGSPVATNGDSSLTQTFTVPTGATALSLYYANNCPDTVTYDWVTITLRDNTAGTTRTLVPRTCAPQYIWTNVTASVTAGHSYTLTLTSHDDNFSSDPTYTLFDDVLLR
ncbi:MAG: hypothetical protein LC689_19450, partial [Myxococcales bacterium]|nr:hypothetical protein [Myxococcales bacterium]